MIGYRPPTTTPSGLSLITDPISWRGVSDYSRKRLGGSETSEIGGKSQELLQMNSVTRSAPYQRCSRLPNQHRRTHALVLRLRVIRSGYDIVDDRGGTVRALTSVEREQVRSRPPLESAMTETLTGPTCRRRAALTRACETARSSSSSRHRTSVGLLIGFCSTFTASERSQLL